ncbi:MAG: flotillin family protein [Verrucomicrobiales bacterium]|nr:flotillin family protein [Verrucomicrobiales bacterium]
MMELVKQPAVLSGAAAFALIVIMLSIASRFYVRASKESAFVRTGLGGQKVIADGGAIVLPIFQQITPVNMMTLRLQVERANNEALITLDRIRADVKAEFFVRVKKDTEAIAQAAQSFGGKTLHPEELREILQGKFVDALRAVAAGMDMQTLHEKRADFVQSVQTTVAEDLAKNGLELESVSLTGLDQTSVEYFNATNSFDAQGLANIARITEAKREERNKIEQETRIRIEQKNLEAEQQSLTIRQQGEFARLSQEREVSMRRAEQESLIKTEQAMRHREAEESSILAAKQIALQNINKERELEQSQMEKKRQIETADIARRQAVEMSQQEAAITIAEKSEAKSKAEADASKALAEKVREEENVITVRMVAEANRRREVEVISARQEAEREATKVTVAAEAEKKAAEDLALARLTAARAEAESVIIKADADRKKFEAEAYGARAINEAKNMLGENVMAYEMRTVLAQVAPALIAASMKPLENIESVRVISTNGPLIGGYGGGGNGSAGDGGGEAGGGNVPDQLVNALLRHRVQLPIVDDLLKQLGIASPTPAGISNALLPAPSKPPEPPELQSLAHS